MHLAARIPDSARGMWPRTLRPGSDSSALTGLVPASAGGTAGPCPASATRVVCESLSRPRLQDIVELLVKNDDGSWNMDGAFTTRLQNTKGKFPEPPVGDLGVGASRIFSQRESRHAPTASSASLLTSRAYRGADAEAIRDLFKEVLPTANEARKERAQRVWNDKHAEYQKSCSATMVGVL